MQLRFKLLTRAAKAFVPAYFQPVVVVFKGTSSNGEIHGSNVQRNPYAGHKIFYIPSASI